MGRGWSSYTLGYIPKYFAIGSHSARLLLKLTSSLRQIIATTTLTSDTEVIGIKVGLACMSRRESCPCVTSVLRMVRVAQHMNTRIHNSTINTFHIFNSGQNLYTTNSWTILTLEMQLGALKLKQRAREACVGLYGSFIRPHSSEFCGCRFSPGGSNPKTSLFFIVKSQRYVQLYA